MDLNDFFSEYKYIVCKVVGKMHLTPNISMKDLITVGESALFIAYCRGIDFKKPKSKIRSYLHLVIHGEIIDFWRKESFGFHRTQGTFTISEFNEMRSSKGEDTVSIAESNILRKEINEGLNNSQKRTLQLILDGYTQKEIGEILEVHESSVSLYKKRIKQRVSKLI